jgi:hypothetical protein
VGVGVHTNDSHRKSNEEGFNQAVEKEVALQMARLEKKRKKKVKKKKSLKKGSQRNGGKKSDKPQKKKRKADIERQADIDTGISSFLTSVESFYKQKKTSSKDGEDVPDNLSQRLELWAQRKFADKKLPYVPLGGLVLVEDPQWESCGPKLALKVGSSAKVKCEQSFKTPQDWYQFTQLFDRLKLGMVLGAGNAKSKEIFGYFEKLTLARNQRLCSDKALIMFDERNRKRKAGSWNWLTIDTFDLLLVAQEFPLSKAIQTFQQNKPNNQPSNQPKKPRVQHSDADRTANGLCNNFDKKSQCRFDHCKFAHWCIKPVCLSQGRADHNAKDCVEP